MSEDLCPYCQKPQGWHALNCPEVAFESQIRVFPCVATDTAVPATKLPKVE